MIHKKLVEQKIKEYQIQGYVKDSLRGVGLSSTKLQVTPLGEKIIVRAARPGLVVGRKGQSIKKLTNMLKKKFGLENPQIEIDEVKDVKQDPAIIAETIASYLERFGSARFKSIGHRCLEDCMKSGAYGVEIIISGKVPSQRSKNWRFYKGYLKKCGELSISGVKKAYTTAFLKTGSIGIQVRVMPGDINLLDKIDVFDEPVTEVEDITSSAGSGVDEGVKTSGKSAGEEKADEGSSSKGKKSTKKKASAKKSTTKKSTTKKSTTKKSADKKSTTGKTTTKKASKKTTKKASMSEK